MPGRRIGSTTVTARYLGSQPVKSRYLGSTLIWTSTRVRDSFDDKDLDGEPINIDLDDTGRYVDLGSSTDYKIAVHDGVCRLDLPDGLIVQAMRSSKARHVTQHPSDDGYIECRPATKGNGTPPIFSGATYVTELFRRCNNTGSTHTTGVGMRLRESQLFIVGRNNTGFTLEKQACGSFAANDIIRLKSVGNIHTMYRNGTIVGVWDDSTVTAPGGASNRSVMVRCDASKDLLGPRRFSPALDYIEFG